MSDLLKRIANYFANEYDGDDKTAPKMELSVDELRYIPSIYFRAFAVRYKYIT